RTFTPPSGSTRARPRQARRLSRRQRRARAELGARSDRSRPVPSLASRVTSLGSADEFRGSLRSDQETSEPGDEGLTDTGVNETIAGDPGESGRRAAHERLSTGSLARWARARPTQPWGGFSGRC